MAYDIPQELRYKEIFAYGITLRQFIYLAVFGVAAVLIFSEDSIPDEIGTLIAIAFIGFAVLLGFFDLDRRIIELISFMRTPKNITFLSKGASKFLGIKYLRDSAIVLSDGTLIGIVRVDAINFSILSRDQKNAVIYNFMNFLNSLDFRVQIIMRTVTLDMSKYLLNLEKKVSENPEGSIAEYYRFRDFLERYTEENKVTDRVFYIAVPLKDTRKVGLRYLSKQGLSGKSILSFRELDERIEVIGEWLSKSMLDSKRLNNQELLVFLSSFFASWVKFDAGYTSPYTTHKNEDIQKKAQGENR